MRNLDTADELVKLAERIRNAEAKTAPIRLEAGSMTITEADSILSLAFKDHSISMEFQRNAWREAPTVKWKVWDGKTWHHGPTLRTAVQMAIAGKDNGAAVEADAALGIPMIKPGEPCGHPMIEDGVCSCCHADMRAAVVGAPG
jgi:hypothetical protein